MGCCEKYSANEDENRERGNWASKYDYLLSLAGMAVGLGNVWRFPYLCYKNGGGAFLIPYVLMLVFVGMPMFLLETSMGQFSSSTVLKLYDICPALRGVAFASLMATVLATTYYCVLIAYPLIFIWESFTTDTLPWATCDNPWNTADCTTTMQWNPYFNHTENYSTPKTSASEEFFHKKVLQLSSGIEEAGGLVPAINIANVIVWLVVFLIIFKGVKVIGKVVWFTALFPFVILSVLLVRGLTLPGAFLGISYYLVPQFSSLLSVQVWADAAVQIFFSLGTSWGSLFCLGSFSRYRNNTLHDAMLIPIVNGVTSFVAGLVVFSVLGFMAVNTGQSMEEVVTAGIDLAFITYPAAIAMMPGSQFWSVAFFLMIFFLGIDSCFVQVETVVVALTDYFHCLRNRKALVTAVVCVVIHQFSLLICTNSGIYWLSLLDGAVVTYAIIFIGFLEMVVFSYIYGPGRLIRDIQVMTGVRVSGFTWFNWMYSCPIILVFIFADLCIRTGSSGYGSHVFPGYIQATGLVLALSSILIVPGYWIYYMMSAEGTFLERLSVGHFPTTQWGPSLEHHRTEWLAYCSTFNKLFVTRYCMPSVSFPSRSLESTKLVDRPGAASGGPAEAHTGAGAGATDPSGAVGGENSVLLPIGSIYPQLGE